MEPRDPRIDEFIERKAKLNQEVKEVEALRQQILPLLKKHSYDDIFYDTRNKSVKFDREGLYNWVCQSLEKSVKGIKKRRLILNEIRVPAIDESKLDWLYKQGYINTMAMPAEVWENPGVTESVEIPANRKRKKDEQS
jgi:hypothetical protein